jgi:hypothetical protein
MMVPIHGKMTITSVHKALRGSLRSGRMRTSTTAASHKNSRGASRMMIRARSNGLIVVLERNGIPIVELKPAKLQRSPEGSDERVGITGIFISNLATRLPM